jgi:5-formyltetrahydrofolate cyclo-ligase
MVESADIFSREAIRQHVWSQLRTVARPDSRFHWNFAEFIADYEGSEIGAERLQAFPAWQHSKLMFITPDNNLEVVRRKAMEDGRRFVMSTYGIARGFLSIDPARISPHDYGWAATLDGMDRFGQPLNLLDIGSLGRFDLLVTGASAVSTNGIRFGSLAQLDARPLSKLFGNSDLSVFTGFIVAGVLYLLLARVLVPSVSPTREDIQPASNP